MKNSLFALVLVFAALLIMRPVPTEAIGVQAIRVVNDSDAWVWVTAYMESGRVNSAWCVAPGKSSHNGFVYHITRLRGEVTHKNCSHPVIQDLSINTRDMGVIVATLKGSNGKYAFTK